VSSRDKRSATHLRAPADSGQHVKLRKPAHAYGGGGRGTRTTQRARVERHCGRPCSFLPEPMLARSGSLPAGSGWSYEVKWDGFRAIVSTDGALRVRSRRGWNTSARVDFLARLPVRAVLDGLSHSTIKGSPTLPASLRVRAPPAVPGTTRVHAFDVLSVEGEKVTSRPYSGRRRIPEEMQLEGSHWRTPETFDDGQALWHAICEHELEGVVAKRRSSRYVPGERGWVKIKNRDYWRWEIEREGAIRAHSP
jgi:ATP-dependent DNA ligase